MRNQTAPSGKVFGLGLARTGTTAMHEAMGILGVRSAPSSAVLIDGLDERFLDSYQAFFDNPIPFLYLELAERFPDARFVVTWRPIDGWLRSMEWLYGPGLDRLDAKTRELGDRVHRELYGTDRFDRDRLQTIYDEHYESLRNWAKDRDDVLWIDQSKGFTWEPLCEFLGLPVPSVPFPEANPATAEPTNVHPLRRGVLRRLRSAILRRLSAGWPGRGQRR